MNGEYEKEIEEASTLLASAFLREEGDLETRALGLDRDVLGIVRRVGVSVVTQVLRELSARVTSAAAASGLHVHRRSDAVVWTVLGRVTVPSPYLRNPETKETARPVKDELGLRGRRRTHAVERALVDFGIEDSFELASRRFHEHYGHEVGRTTMLRVVEERAADAEVYVADRLTAARAAYNTPVGRRPGAEQMLIELDGSMIRMGSLVEAAEPGLTEVRGLPRRRRDEAWREVRVGFARKPEDADKIYVARMDKYPRLADDLFNAAVARGLSERTDVFAVSDGGNGLREELDAHFDGLTFLLDRPHLKQHLFATAEAMNLVEEPRRDWVENVLLLIDEGHVLDVISYLRDYKGTGEERATQLSGYLERFGDALDYRGAHAKGLPLGSGEVESAHRYIPQKRLKIPGACWSPRNINPLLALRTLRANDWWDDFWSERTDVRRAA